MPSLTDSRGFFCTLKQMETHIFWFCRLILLINKKGFHRQEGWRDFGNQLVSDQSMVDVEATVSVHSKQEQGKRREQ